MTVIDTMIEVVIEEALKTNADVMHVACDVTFAAVFQCS